LTYVYPEIDPITRTLKVRLEFDNPGELLKPDMYASILIMGPEKTNRLMIPREALIRTGTSERVIVALGEGKFQPAKVTAGLESNNKIEILNGLSEGEDVVVSAQFLIDSEASFTGSTLRMSPAQKNNNDNNIDMDMDMDMQEMDK
jgi:Cu(I)/Ag(I) efflux system membrane fusion protein